ncbi:MAG TPA: hypothetical protein VHV10_19020, partial [Ktedonobacteraceae bacterium]|nr:hypothetical protein [Ktedonobacteraceae bacterium]
SHSSEPRGVNTPFIPWGGNAASFFLFPAYREAFLSGTSQPVGGFPPTWSCCQPALLYLL